MEEGFRYCAGFTAEESTITMQLPLISAAAGSTAYNSDAGYCHNDLITIHQIYLSYVNFPCTANSIRKPTLAAIIMHDLLIAVLLNSNNAQKVAEKAGFR